MTTVNRRRECQLTDQIKFFQPIARCTQVRHAQKNLMILLVIMLPAPRCYRRLIKLHCPFLQSEYLGPNPNPYPNPTLAFTTSMLLLQCYYCNVNTSMLLLQCYYYYYYNYYYTYYYYYCYYYYNFKQLAPEK